MVIDWSASNRAARGADTIWIADGTRARGPLHLCTENPPTREAAVEILRTLLLEHLQAEHRILVGFDFPYGYPAGFAAALGLPVSLLPWRSTWEELASLIDDRPDNRNNRWAVAATLNGRLGPGPGPFWGCPNNAATPSLRSRRREDFDFPYGVPTGGRLAEYRHTELALRASRRRPHSVWKLYTSGSVGSQALLGIPRLLALTRDRTLAPFTRVWPFETGFTPRPSPAVGPFLLHAEVWPGAILVPTPAPNEIKDRIQVTALVRHLADLDASGRLGAAFAHPSSLDEPTLQDCVSEEGWILLA